MKSFLCFLAKLFFLPSITILVKVVPIAVTRFSSSSSSSPPPPPPPPPPSSSSSSSSSSEVSAQLNSEVYK